MGTEERHHQRAAEMNLKATLVTPLMLCLVTGAPSPYNEVQSAPQTKSVSCRTEYEPYTETECTTEYKEDCEFQWEGYGNNKVWAKIPGTCKQNPYDKCQDVRKTKEKQVAYPVCNDVPEQKCVDVPKQHCRQIPDQVCTNQPLQQWENVPRQHCTTKHKKVPVRISKNIPKKVCDTGYGYSANPPNTPPEVVLDIERSNPNTNLLKNNKIVFADK